MIFSKDKLLKLKRALLNLGEISTNEGLLIYDGENLEVGKEVFVEGDEGLVPVKDGLYTYNNEIIEVEGGVVKTISEKEVDQPTEEVVEEVVEEQIEQLKAEIENLKVENEDLKKKLEEPLAEPAEEQFKNEKPIEKETKIDFSKYIKRK